MLLDPTQQFTSLWWVEGCESHMIWRVWDRDPQIHLAANTHRDAGLSVLRPYLEVHLLVVGRRLWIFYDLEDLGSGPLDPLAANIHSLEAGLTGQILCQPQTQYIIFTVTLRSK
jgi:hypothetical protein